MITQHISPEPVGAWQASAYVGAREATCVRPIEATGPRTPRTGPAKDPARAQAEAARRARAKVRRTAGEHRLNRLMTLTYASPQHDRATAVHDFQKAIKRLTRAIGPVRYVAVIEEHPGGHGIHWHIAFDRFIQKETLARCWGLGFVDARRLKHAHGNGGAQAGRYLAKYLTKDVGCSGRSTGGKRYLVSTGLDLHPHVRRFHSLSQAEAWCRHLMGGAAPVHVWDSGSDPDWRGPPCTFAMW